jgi:hypothetical protein
MSAYKPRKRSRRSTALHEDDDEAVDTATHEEIEVVDKAGRVRIKRVLVPLRLIPEKRPTPPPFLPNPTIEPDGHEYHRDEHFPSVPQKSNKVSRL